MPIESEPLTIALAERDAFRDALAAVMRTLRSTAESPTNNATYAHARSLLAQAGVGAAEAAVYQAAHDEWAQRVARREKQRTCPHPRVVGDGAMNCADCEKALVAR